MWHDSILVSKVKSLQGSQGGSVLARPKGWAELSGTSWFFPTLGTLLEP
jgi:hypothetical protein